jgi:hypothetical protein
MASLREERRGETTCAVGVSPEVVEAGAEVTLTAKVSCSPGCDLRGQTVLLRDEAGSELGSIELTEFDGEATHGGPLVVKAPLKPGQHTWLAVCSAAVKQDQARIDTSTSVAFIVKPHTTHVVAWDVPSAVEPDERFTLKVDIRCSNACDLANARFGVYDHEGALVATGALGDDAWPGTTALYVAEVAAQAAVNEGLYTWHVRGPHTDSEMPHAEGSVSVGVRVVRHPEYLITVAAVDRIDRTPIEGARVVMHPYRTVTDKRGIAEMRVASGDYKLFVSQTRYLTFGLPIEVTADMSATAELDLEPEVERN